MSSAEQPNGEPTRPYDTPLPIAPPSMAAPGPTRRPRTLWLVLGAVAIALVCFFSGATAATGFITITHAMHHGTDRPGFGPGHPGGRTGNGNADGFGHGHGHGQGHGHGRGNGERRQGGRDTTPNS